MTKAFNIPECRALDEGAQDELTDERDDQVNPRQPESVQNRFHISWSDLETGFSSSFEFDALSPWGEKVGTSGTSSSMRKPSHV
jgi:hypothetical protein